MISTDARHLVMGTRDIWIPGFSSSTTTGWMPLVIPKEAQMVHFTLIAGGGGGGRPNVAAATAGAGGGGCSGVTHWSGSVSTIGRMLYVSIGLGGAGATANNTPGVSGSASYVSLRPTTIGEEVLCYANSGGGGNQSGTAGVAGSNALIGSMDLAHLGIWTASAGQAGGGGAATNGSSVAVATSTFISGGAGGGGSSGGNGGSQISGSARYPTLSGGATGDNPGANGIALRDPLTFIGGAGGGGINGAGTGANRGGNGGGYGSGGGGGGNATSGVSGNGGNGAPGLLIVRWW